MKHPYYHSGFLIAWLLVLYPSIPAAAKYGGGSGTAEDPYLIYTAEHLNQIGLHDSDLDEHFLMMADINLSEFPKREFNIIGRDEQNPFAGVFDGNGFRILNFSYKANFQDYVGLFGVVGENEGNDTGEIRDLGLVDVNIDAGNGFSAGGIVGFLAKGLIENCYVRNGTITNHSHFAGGIAGASFGLISASYADIRVLGVYEVGGVTGLLGEPGTLLNCYARGRVSGFQYVGGLVGDMREHTRMEHCYSTGKITGDLDFGGLVGINSGEIESCIWDFVSSEIEFMCGTIDNGSGCSGDGGKTPDEMQLEDTFDDEGWDFDTPIWKIKEGQEPPRLWWEILNPATFLFLLDGDQVVGGVDTEATGTGIVRLDPENNEISWDITYEELHLDPNTEITAALIHGPAEPNQIGLMQIDVLTNSISAHQLVSLEPISISELQGEDLRSGLWYVEIGTARNPEGEIRGQISKKNDIHASGVTIKAGKSREDPVDSLKATGGLYLSTDDATPSDLIYSETIEFALINQDSSQNAPAVILQDSIVVDVNPNKLNSNGVYNYKRSKHGNGPVQVLKIDFLKNTFILDAKQVDLSGLRLPFAYTIHYGAYQGTMAFTQANALHINKGKPLPVCLLSGVADALRVDKAKVKTSKKGDSLTMQGGIAAGAIALNLHQEEITIEWGDFSETLPTGSLTVKKGRNYSYKKPKGNSGAISTLAINLDKCTLKLSLKEAPELAKQGTVLFKIHSANFQAEDEVLF